MPQLCIAQISVCLSSSRTYSQVSTGAPKVVGEQLLLQGYACFKIKYHALCICFFRTHLTVTRTKQPPGTFSQRNGAFGGPCLKLSISTYQGCINDVGRKTAFRRLMFQLLGSLEQSLACLWFLTWL